MVNSIKEQVLSIRRYCALEFVEAERRGASGKEQATVNERMGASRTW
jgi:hypothetical protein